MELSNSLVKQFVEATTDEKTDTKESTVYGTIVEYNNELYARIDGSDILTPISTTAELKTGERVIVTLKNHSATVTGNITDPSASSTTVKEIGTKVDEFGKIVADVVTTEELNAEIARIDKLYTDNVVIGEKLTAAEGDIENLEANKASVKDLEAAEADITELKAKDVEITGKLEAAEAEIDELDVNKASIEQLNVAKADIKELQANNVEITGKLAASEADILELETKKLDAEQANLKYAQIDFANIGEAAVKKLFTESGIIEDIIVSDGKITGELVGVTIKGDLIEAGTLKADKLVILGSDGLYYKLNTNGETVESQQTEYNSLDGKHILAKSITATKIAVDDLVAFNATIGGFHITNSSLYSGAKASVDNTTVGTYLDKEGQVAFGDGNNYLKFYKDQNGNFKLAISASEIVFSSSNKNVEDELKEIKDEVTTNLRIESSRGTVFKNDSIATVLSAVVYRGSQRITDINTLRAAMGSGAYLQWKWQRLDEDSFGVISSSDSRLGNDGFTFTLSPTDVNTKVTFLCELIV